MKKQEAGFIVTDEYRKWIALIKDRIKSSQIKASIQSQQRTAGALLAHWCRHCKPSEAFKMGRRPSAPNEH